ncbi:MAG: hypothetical protein MJ175_13325, partial [Clostridia bacterium]|nr:hypothetical protein [Clostridia bacterium]
FGFGSIPGDQSTPGGMENITCRNITVMEKQDSSIFAEILMSGREGKYIDDVTLENITVCGEPLTAYKPGDYVRNLKIR